MQVRWSVFLHRSQCRFHWKLMTGRAILHRQGLSVRKLTRHSGRTKHHDYALENRAHNKSLSSLYKCLKIWYRRKAEEASNCSWQMSPFCVQGPWREAWRSYLFDSDFECRATLFHDYFRHTSRGNDEMLTYSGVRKFPRYAVLSFGTPEPRLLVGLSDFLVLLSVKT